MTRLVKTYTQLTLPGFRLEERGLTPEGQPSFEEWQRAGEALRKVEGAVHWWIGDWLNFGEAQYGEKYTQALEATGFDYETLVSDKWVSAQIEILRRRSNLTWSHHREVASLQPAEQDELLATAEQDGLSRQELRQRVREHKSAKAIEAAGDLPRGKFGVVYADPPWQYDFSNTENREIENHYPTMTVEQIQAMGQTLPASLSQDCILFCWATSPKLREAIDVVAAWGFVYLTCMVWVKDKIGMGYYARQRHELLLIAARGNPPVPEAANRPDSVIEAPRTEHSRKPDQVYDIIEQMYPAAQKLELFSRSKRRGWKAWGNQA